VDDVLCQTGPHERQRLVEKPGPFASLDAERLLLVRVGDTEAECR